MHSDCGFVSPAGEHVNVDGAVTVFVEFADRHFVEIVEFNSGFAGSDVDVDSIFSLFVHLLFERLFENKIC